LLSVIRKATEVRWGCFSVLNLQFRERLNIKVKGCTIHCVQVWFPAGAMCVVNAFPY